MPTALIGLLFAVLTVIMAAPWSLHPASRVVVDNPDTQLFLWTLGWDAHALATNPLGIFDANIFYPFPNTLAYSENAIGSAFLAAPIIWLTGDLVLALNLVLLLSTALCGVGAYVLGRRLGLSTAAAILTGLVFAFAPTRFFRMSQLHLVAVQWLPLTLAATHAYLHDGRRRDLRLALGGFTLQALASGHGAVMLVVSLAALLAHHVVAQGGRLDLRRRLADAGWTGALLLLPALLLLMPYRRARADIGLDRTLERWGVTPDSFLATPSLVDRWLLRLVTTHDMNAGASAFLFPGVLVLLLAALALWPGGVPALPRRHIGLYAVLAALSLAFFAGGPFDLWPWVHAWPGFNFIRVPSRFMILTTLALAVLAGAGFERLTRRLPAPRRAAAGLVAGLLVLAECSAHPFDGVPFVLPAPGIVTWVAAQPRPFVVAEVPVPRASEGGAFERFQTAAMLHSTAHWQPTVHGYSGIQPPLHARIYADLHDFPDPRSIATLREFKVTYVLVHRALYAEEAWQDLSARLRATPHLRLVHDGADGAVFQLDAM